ncbi:hypothetical protein ACIRS3_17560 [Streptomyces virginiae]|uniref:hypothetical protein n=1 Tax=Streptomyces virginiae TaxID=1961 RepID=UPI0038242E6F
MSGVPLALPHVPEEGETIARHPSLRRVAEGKLARWRGADAMRKRQVVKDLAVLAADRSGRRADLFVIGPEPARFLRTSATTAARVLDRVPSSAQLPCRCVLPEAFTRLLR